MTIKEREQTINDLQEIVDNYSGSWKRFNVFDNALALIKELTEEIKDFEEEYDRVYEQVEADIRGNMADGGTSCHWCIAGHRADVVRKMQDLLAMHFGTYTAKDEVKVLDVVRLINQITEDMLEEEYEAILE